MVKQYCKLCGCYRRYFGKLHLCKECLKAVENKILDRKCLTEIKCQICGKDGINLCSECQKEISDIKYRKELRKKEDKQRRIILD